MKTISLVTTILILLIMYPFQIVYAQFTNPNPFTFPEQTYSAGTVNGRNTGCDIKEYSGDVYRVSVWEPTGTTQSFGWVVTIGATQYTGTLPFTATGAIGDPDVCLLIKPITNAIFAAVVYFDITNAEWDLEFYRWDLPSAQFVPTTLFFQLATGPFGTSINIDGNDHPDSEFAIVWDDVSGDIHTTVGDMGSLVLYNDLTLISGTHPDVSLFYNGSSDVVHLAYLDGSGDLQLLDYDFADLAAGNAGNSSSILSQAPQNGGVYSYPRIACPNGAQGSSNEWTIVVEEMDLVSSPNKYYIVGYNTAYGNTDIIFNDGTTPSPADLTLVPNYYVSVCYDSNYPSDGVWVGWQFDNTSVPCIYDNTMFGYGNLIEQSGYSIILKCDQTALPIGTPDYLQVPTAITANNGDLSGFLSLAGRYRLDELFLTYQNIIINSVNVDDINFKTITGAGSISTLRESISNITSTNSQEQFDDDEPLELKILSIEGKLKFHERIVGKDIQIKLIEYSKLLSSAIYLVNLHAVETGIHYRYKALLGQ